MPPYLICAGSCINPCFTWRHRSARVPMWMQGTHPTYGNVPLNIPWLVFVSGKPNFACLQIGALRFPGPHLCNCRKPSRCFWGWGDCSCVWITRFTRSGPQVTWLERLESAGSFGYLHYSLTEQIDIHLNKGVIIYTTFCLMQYHKFLWQHKCNVVSIEFLSSVNSWKLVNKQKEWMWINMLILQCESLIISFFRLSFQSFNLCYWRQVGRGDGIWLTVS